MAKSDISSYQQGVGRMTDKIDMSGLVSVLTGVSAGGAIASLSALFDQNILDDKGFQKVIESLEPLTYKIVSDGYNITEIYGNPENLVDPLDPAKGLNIRYDFSRVLDVYAAGLDKALIGDAVAGALLAVGLYALAKDKKFSSALFGASTGAAVYSAITASQYSQALAEMPFQIGGTNLVDYTVNNPQFAESLKPLVDDLAVKLSISKWASIGLATIAGIGFIYSAVKNLPRTVNYQSDMIE